MQKKQNKKTSRHEFLNHLKCLAKIRHLLILIINYHQGQEQGNNQVQTQYQLMRKLMFLTKLIIVNLDKNQYKSYPHNVISRRKICFGQVSVLFLAEEYLDRVVLRRQYIHLGGVDFCDDNSFQLIKLLVINSINNYN